MYSKKGLVIILLAVPMISTINRVQAASIVQFKDSYEVPLKIENPCGKLDLIKEKPWQWIDHYHEVNSYNRFMKYQCDVKFTEAMTRVRRSLAECPLHRETRSAKWLLGATKLMLRGVTNFVSAVTFPTDDNQNLIQKLLLEEMDVEKEE